MMAMYEAYTENTKTLTLIINMWDRVSFQMGNRTEKVYFLSHRLFSPKNL